MRTRRRNACVSILLGVFASQTGGSLLEVEEVAPFTILFESQFLKNATPCLQISDMLPELDKKEAKVLPMNQLGNLAAVMRHRFNQSLQRSDREGLVGQGWNREQRVVNEALASNAILRKDGI